MEKRSIRWRASIWPPLLSLLLFVLSGPARPAPAGDLESGMRAFENGDYHSALVLFEAARDAGLDSPAIHYNIAVSLYRLQRFEAARRTFVLISNRYPSMRGLAEYNLGLVAQRLGNDSAARAHFLNAYEMSPDNRTIRILASRRLRELEPDSATAARWTGAIGVRGGHDDNVALRSESVLPAGAAGDSPMADLFASLSGPWTGRNGFRLEGSAYLIKYFDADAFDQSEISGGAFYDGRRDDWRLQGGIRAGAGSLGGETFDRKFGVYGRLLRYVGDKALIDVRYAYDDVTDADSRFAGIDGSRQQLDLRYRWYQENHRVQLGYHAEINDRADPGVSPDRNRLSADYRFQPETGFGFEAGFDWRRSDYSELAIPREEDLFTLRAGVRYALSINSMVLLELRTSENDSTDDSLSYDRNQFTVGLLRVF